MLLSNQPKGSLALRLAPWGQKEIAFPRTAQVVCLVEQPARDLAGLASKPASKGRGAVLFGGNVLGLHYQVRVKNAIRSTIIAMGRSMRGVIVKSGKAKIVTPGPLAAKR